MIPVPVENNVKSLTLERLEGGKVKITAMFSDNCVSMGEVVIADFKASLTDPKLLTPFPSTLERVICDPEFAKDGCVYLFFTNNNDRSLVIVNRRILNGALERL